MRHSFVTAGGLRLRVGRAGEGPPLLLISGIGASIDMWEPLVERLTGSSAPPAGTPSESAKRFALIAFDAPGTGESQRPRRPLRMRELAGVARELLDALSVARADVLGYSWGGGLAQELARRAPERVRSLILCATAVGLGGIPPRPLAALALATPARYYHPRLLALSVPRIAGGVTARDPSVLEAHAGARLRRPPDMLGYAYQLCAVAGWTSLPWLHRLTMPALVLAGDDDPSVPVTNARLLAARLPDATLHVIRGGGHLFLLDQPDDAVPAIERFLVSRSQ